MKEHELEKTKEYKYEHKYWYSGRRKDLSEIINYPGKSEIKTY